MIIVVVGCGNVGANLLQHIADLPGVDKIWGVDITDDHVQAAIMDVAGVKPHEARKIHGTTSNHCLSEADIIVFTAGVKTGPGETAKDAAKKNFAVIAKILKGITLKDSAIFITLPSPVDQIATFIQRKTALAPSQVIGFGGSLDLNRLVYVLESKGIESTGAAIVGEHGPRTIPVYETEKDYDAVAHRVGHFLADIGKLAGQKRNLATGPLLSELIRSIVQDSGDAYYVSGHHPDHDLYLMWPFHIGRNGAVEPLPMALPPRAQREFDSLVEQKKTEAAAIEDEI